MQYFVITANVERVKPVTREIESKSVFWNSFARTWTEEPLRAKRYTSRGRAESVANKLSTKRAKNITVEEVLTVNS